MACSAVLSPPRRWLQVTHRGKPIDWGQWAITSDDPVFSGAGNKDSGDDYAAAPGGLPLRAVRGQVAPRWRALPSGSGASAASLHAGPSGLRALRQHRGGAVLSRGRQHRRKGDAWVRPGEACTLACNARPCPAPHPAPADLDHHNPELRESLVDWLNWLLTDIGFEGWRFDFVRGYAAKYVKE